MHWPDRCFFNSSRKYNLACASEMGAPLLRCASGMVCGRPSPPDQWRRGIILGLSHIGDVLFRTSSLPVLAEALPNCKWSFLLEKSSAEILRNNPYVDHILPYRESNGFPYLSKQNTSMLREHKYDVALCVSPMIYWTDLLTSSLLRIPNRVAFINKGLTGLITFAVDLKLPQPFAVSFQKMVSEVTGVSPDWSVSPKVYLDKSNYEKADKVWHELIQDHRPVIAVCPATRQVAEKWPPEYMAELIDILQMHLGFRCILCGGNADINILESIRIKCKSEVSLNAGMLGLLDLAAFFERCSGVVCMDSGPRHIANAVNTPAFFFRNLSVNHLEVKKYCDSETDLAGKGDFLSPAQQISHLQNILPDTVAEIIKTRLCSDRIN